MKRSSPGGAPAPAFAAARGTDPVVGLCLGCRHSRQIETSRGSRFFRCERAGADPVLPRYPRLPVQDCTGYEPARS